MRNVNDKVRLCSSFDVTFHPALFRRAVTSKFLSRGGGRGGWSDAICVIFIECLTRKQ